jgi:hypothetical protein
MPFLYGKPKWGLGLTCLQQKMRKKYFFVKMQIPWLSSALFCLIAEQNTVFKFYYIFAMKIATHLNKDL